MNYSKSMDMQEEVKLVEKELVDLIIAHLKVNRIAVETARQQAKDFLSLLPINDKKDLLSKLKGLSEKYEEAKEIYAVEVGKVYETERQQTLAQMRGFIQAGNMDAAIAAAKAMYAKQENQTPEQGASTASQQVPQPVVPQVPQQNGQLPEQKGEA